jgi:hypothetical protein
MTTITKNFQYVTYDKHPYLLIGYDQLEGTCVLLEELDSKPDEPFFLINVPYVDVIFTTDK